MSFFTSRPYPPVNKSEPDPVPEPEAEQTVVRLELRSAEEIEVVEPMSFEDQVKERAYFIWKNTGCQDADQNYYQALQELTETSEVPPMLSPRMNDYGPPSHPPPLVEEMDCEDDDQDLEEVD